MTLALRDGQRSVDLVHGICSSKFSVTVCVWYCVRSSYIIKSEDPTAMINQFCA